MPIDVLDMPRKVPKMISRSMGTTPIIESGTGRILDRVREPERIVGSFDDGSEFDAYVVLEGEQIV